MVTTARHQLTVNLSSNGLTWIDPASLPWPRVKELDLTSNPLHCDCHLTWLTELTSTEIIGAQCAGPGKLTGHTLAVDTPTELMTCSLLAPSHISLLSVILVIISLALGCISFAIYTFRRFTTNWILRILFYKLLLLKSYLQKLASPSEAGHCRDVSDQGPVAHL